ncbi:MAG TPA: hypothetical protein PK767_11650, partial [Clostridiales bacterium]|nr:hypothetical protein [Clostridiales bacterium]
MKFIALILILAIFLACLTSCFGMGIPKKPKDTNLEFWITQDVSETDFSGYCEILGWIGARQYYGSGYQPEVDENGNQTDPEYYVKYKVTAWPDYACQNKHITSIEITDPKVTLYGLTVDSSFDEFEQVFSEMGYEISRKSSGNYERIEASKKRITFSLESNEGKREFTINAEITNVQGIAYSAGTPRGCIDALYQRL